MPVGSTATSTMARSPTSGRATSEIGPVAVSVNDGSGIGSSIRSCQTMPCKPVGKRGGSIGTSKSMAACRRTIGSVGQGRADQVTGERVRDQSELSAMNEYLDTCHLCGHPMASNAPVCPQCFGRSDPMARQAMRLHRQAAAEGKRKQDIERQRERRKLWMLLIMAPVVLALIYVISHSLSPR